MITYTIDMIAEDLYDLYVSDDDGYTWEYFDSYVTYDQAEDDGRALLRGGRLAGFGRLYISHGK